MTELNLLYLHASMLGYGRLGMNLDRELTEMGVGVYDHLPGSEHDIGSAYLAPALTDTRTGRSNVVCWVSFPSHGTGWYEGQVPCVFTMWETMYLPEAFRTSFHEFDTLIVPSVQNLELFSQYHDNVKYVPLGVNPTDWAYVPRTPPTKEFRFLIGGSGQRKGGDLAVKAFKKLWGKVGSWGDGPIPTLTLKSPSGDSYYGDRIRTISGRLSGEDEIALYADAHCYLQPSRGEGFGLQPLQAIAQGCPTILTDGHGHGSFANLGIGLGWKPSKAGYFIFGDAGDWWEPDFDELVDAMRDVYNNYDKHAQEATTASRLAHAWFTWRHTANGFMDAIGRDRLGPYTGPGTWRRVEERKFRVITTRNHAHEVAGAVRAYQAGKEYWVSADIKRILFEGGYLDPRCTREVHPGLTDDQVERAQRPEYENCPTCGKPLTGEVSG